LHRHRIIQWFSGATRIDQYSFDSNLDCPTAQFFPGSGFNQADIDEFNARFDFEYERIRDFIVLHYKATERNDSAFWNYCREMEIPETLEKKIALYRSNGRVSKDGNELFETLNWLQVMHGQGIRAQGYHPLVDLRSKEEIAEFLANIKNVIRKCVDVMPTHADYIAQTCAATSTML